MLAYVRTNIYPVPVLPDIVTLPVLIVENSVSILGSAIPELRHGSEK